MTPIKHKFLDHKISYESETLIVGTFNPDTKENKADFFYGRARNYLWRLLPAVFGEDDLKKKMKADKLDFINRRKIDFIDLISEVNIDQVANYFDTYLDSRVSKWQDDIIIAKIKELNNLKRVCFTRSTFSGIPRIKLKIEEVKEFCEKREIHFQYLISPARFYREDKQQEWTRFFNSI